MKKRAFGAVAAFVGTAGTLTLSTPAYAQAWLQDRRVGDGAGYQAGDFEVHPGIAAQVGYDSNYLGRSDKTGPTLANGAPAAPPIDSGLLAITPSLNLATIQSGKADAPPVGFSAGASGTYREFFASALQNQRNMSVAANALLTILPGREWSGSISASYIRLIQPTILGDPDQSYNTDTISATADLATVPGLGTLDWHFGYTFTGTFFEDSAGSAYNNYTNTAYTRGRWKFRPRTALLYDGTISWRDYPNTQDSSFVLHNQTPVRARIGLEGLVTSRFSVLAMIGYGGTFTSALSATDPSADNYDSVIGNLELRFYPGNNPSTTASTASLLFSQIAIGYLRDFTSSYLDDYVGIDRGYLKAEYFFGQKFVFSVQGGVSAMEHPDLFFGPALSSTPVLMAKSFTDVLADASVFAEYRLIPSVGINASFSYGENFSNTQLPISPNIPIGANQSVYDLNIRHFTAFIGARWFM
jgi:hypothetical protein